MKTVAVIGAGASGLCAVKCCLEEGLRPVCFEKTDDIGGLWNYKPEVIPDQGCVMKSTITTTSKEITCFSDFPMPGEFPIYPHNSYIQKYFRLYADNFGLLKHIQFATEVVHVGQRPDFDLTGQWHVMVKRKGQGPRVEEEFVFDAVLICNGYLWSVNKPAFPGIDRFQGEVIHSRDYKDVHGYAGKKVVVIGLGDSGADAAVELSLVASKVLLSSRDGKWVMSRVSYGGQPLDMVMLKRASMLVKRFFPGLASKLSEAIVNQGFNHEMYSLNPRYPFHPVTMVVCDELPSRLLGGAVVLKPNVTEFSAKGVRFEDDTFEDNVDVVLLATGYKPELPFLDDSVLDLKGTEPDLFKCVFPPDLSRPTLGLIGYIDVSGPAMPASEMQCRLATKVFKGEVSLPARGNMREINRRFREQTDEGRYRRARNFPPLVDYIPYMDDLADMIGCKPSFGKLLLTDPKLALNCWFSACTPYQFRLQGPGAWAGARHAILTQWERTLQPLQTRPRRVQDQGSKATFYFFLASLCAVLVLMYAW